MFGLKTKTEEPEAPPVPSAYVPVPRQVEEKVVPPLVELAMRGSRLLDGRAPWWAFAPHGQLLGPPDIVNMGREDHLRIAPDEMFVIDLAPPEGVDPRRWVTLDDEVEAHIRRQVRGCFYRPTFEARPKCWQVGMAPPPEVVVEASHAVPARGLDLGVPLTSQVVQAIVSRHRLDQAARSEGTGLTSRQLVRISLAYSPQTGAGRTVNDDIERERHRWILTNSLEDITPELLGRVRVAPDGTVHWLPPDAG